MNTKAEAAETPSPIQYRQNDKGFAVSLPFELKDAFRDTFPSAKWNRDGKFWQVGPRSKKRLEQFTEQLQDSAIRLEQAKQERAERVLACDEAERLVEQAKESIEAVQLEAQHLAEQAAELEEELAELRQQLQQKKALLASMETERAAVRAVQQKIQQERETERQLDQQMREEFEQRVDIEAVLGAIATLKACYGSTFQDKHYKVKGDRFCEALGVLQREEARLEEQGYVSIVLSRLAHMNFNRPDRDYPGSYRYDEIYQLKKIKR